MRTLTFAALGCLIGASAQADNFCGEGYKMTGDGCRAINAPAWGNTPRQTTGKNEQADDPTKARLAAAAVLIRLHGYSCKMAVGMRDAFSMSGGYVVHCEGDRPNTEYWYDLQDRGGHYTVTPR